MPLLPRQRQLAYVRSRSAMTLGAGLLLSSLLHVRRDEDLIFTPQGKPFLAAGTAAFSLSHSYGHVLLGASDGPIGVDMEKKDRHVTAAVQNRICLPQEKALDPLLVFTRKECAMKLTGLGFSLPPKTIDTRLEYRWQDTVYRFFTIEQDGFVISVLSAEEALPPIQRVTPEELL